MPKIKYMQKCLELAALGLGQTRSNPLVGSVLVYQDEIVAQGYHKQYGASHAEVEAINALGDKSILPDCSLYVNLEPCSHFGKTPPCADLIVSSGIKKVFIGAGDPNPKVSGAGIEKLKSAGCQTEVGLLENECRQLNRRFYTFHQKKRPWIILKWAQSSDGFISKSKFESTQISCAESMNLVHLWRHQEMSVLVGTQTALTDNPRLTARIPEGINPVRVLIDRDLRMPLNSNLLDSKADTIVFCACGKTGYPSNIELVEVEFDQNLEESICQHLFKRKLISCIIEGGSYTLNRWIRKNLFDEARVFVSPFKLTAGVAAPKLDFAIARKSIVGDDILNIIDNSH